MRESLFDFYELVIVVSDDKGDADINGLTGVIVGKSANEKGEWVYAVKIDNPRESNPSEVWSLEENKLCKAGKVYNEGDVYTGAALKVTDRGDLND